jgi:predicted DsbA family dithiol-disulfide isomerase
VWLDTIGQHYGDRLQIHWRYFSLEQANRSAGPGVDVWDAPPGSVSPGMAAFKAAEASRRQGDEAFHRFHRALLAERHAKGRRPITAEVLDDAARAAGLDLGRWRAELGDPTLLAAVARDHTEGVERHGVFGTPTLVFEGGGAAFLKMKPPPPDDEAVAVFDDLYRLATRRPYIAEVKRPVPPSR